jgi:hypothetical protein
MFPRQIVLLSALLLLACSLSGQVTFEKTLDNPLDQYGFDVIQASDSCYMMIGGQYDNYYQWPITDYMMFKVDRSGDLVWAKSYLNAWGDTWGNALAETQDHGFVSCGRYQDSDACIVLCQPDGDSIWSRQFELGDGYGEARGICQASDEGYAFTGVTAGYSNSAAIFVCKTDADGGQVWFKQFHEIGNNDACGTDILQAGDGSLVVCGFQGDTSVLINLSIDGDSVWMERYEDFPSRLYSLKQCEDEGFVACGTVYDSVSVSWDCFLIKTDSGGNQEWVKILGDIDKSELAYDVEITGDNGFIACGPSISHLNYNRDVLLIRTDQNGDTLWTRTFGSPDMNEEAYGIDCTFDGGFILTGYKQVNDTLNNVYLIKTDADGHLTWIWEGPMDKKFPLHIYPNPNHGIFTIDPANLYGNGVLEISNASGVMVHSQVIGGLAKPMRIELYTLEPGIYHAVVRDNRLVTGMGKFILVR